MGNEKTRKAWVRRLTEKQLEAQREERHQKQQAQTQKTLVADKNALNFSADEEALTLENVDTVEDLEAIAKSNTNTTKTRSSKYRQSTPIRSSTANELQADQDFSDQESEQKPSTEEEENSKKSTEPETAQKVVEVDEE